MAAIEKKMKSTPADPPVGANSLEDLDDIVARIADGAAKRDRDRRPPYDIIDIVRRARVGALRVPRNEGGAGASLHALFEVVIRLGDADPNVAHILRNHFAFVEQALRWTTPELRKHWIAEIASGAIFGLAATELGRRQAGAREVTTALTPANGGYRLNGTKYYSTGNLYADYIVVRAARVDATVVSAIVPAHREGVLLEDDWDGIGQRLTGSGTTKFIDVAVTEAEIIPEAAQSRMHHPATFPQLYLTAIIAGILRDVLRDAIELIQSRKRSFYHAPVERPIDDPILQQIVGQISSNAFVAETAVLAAADALEAAVNSIVEGAADEGLAHEASLRAAKAKVVIDDLAIRTANLVFETGGASAAKASAMLDRHWRNIRTLAAHNPVTYKARSIALYELSGVRLPQGAFF